MLFSVVAVFLVGLTISFFSFFSGAESAPCPSSTVAVDIASTADAQNLATALVCTGPAAFEVAWSASVDIIQVIQVSNNKSVTITGSGLHSIRGLLSDDDGASAIDNAGSRTGLFSVSNGSTLRLNNLVLDGGNTDTGGGVEVHSSSSLFVSGCGFKRNNASKGGAIYASTSAVYISSNTSFDDNSAFYGGAIYLHGNSSVEIDGSASFVHNTAVESGGALYASENSALKIKGKGIFSNNSAGIDGGVIYLSESSSALLDGSYVFTNNNAGDDGGAMRGRNKVSSNISGETLFVDNYFFGNGGAMYVSEGSSASIDGDSKFYLNSAGDDGGAIFLVDNITMHINGSVTFTNNSAEDTGGAVGVYKDVAIGVNGDTAFVNNTAEGRGGALYGSTGCVIDFDGDISFANNLANTDGGAVYLFSSSSMEINGNASFVHNRAEDDGGAIYMLLTSSVLFDGNTLFLRNKAEDDGGGIRAYNDASVIFNGNTSFSGNRAGGNGGALYGLKYSSFKFTGSSVINNNFAKLNGGGVSLYGTSSTDMDGSSSFLDNRADNNGGAVHAISSTIAIDGTATFSSNEALNGGGIYSARGSLVDTPGIVHFEGNLAFADGGAMCLTDPDIFKISDAKFILNEAVSGGALSLVATEETTGTMDACQFENNKASYGGALYLSSGEGNVSIHRSNFSNNIAGELGGALFSAGKLYINATKFTGNASGKDGLAIYNFQSSDISLDATFEGNTFSCPSGEYSDVHHAEDTSGLDSCRFSLVCAHCSSECGIIPNTVEMDAKTVPVCKPIPTGVEVMSTSVTLADFNLTAGYYRVSSESITVHECYQPAACVGGTDAANYCAAGYEGPYCAVCTNDTAPGIMRRCHECSEEAVRSGLCVLVVLLILVTIAGVLVLSHLLEDVRVDANWANQAKDNVRAKCLRILRNGCNHLVRIFPLSAVRITVVVLEIVTQFTQIAGTVYPDEYEIFISRLAFSNVDIGVILSSFCIVKTNFYDRLMIATVGPLVLLLALRSTYAAAKRRNWNSERALAIVKHRHLSIVLFVTFILYSSVSFTIFQTFVCDTLDDGGQYLRADFSISCKAGKYKAYRLYATFMAGIYPFGIPAIFGWWLVRNRRDLKTHDRETKTQLKPFRGLWVAYRPSRYYYELVEYCRRVMLTGTAVFVAPGSSTQIAVILLLAAVFSFVSECLSPFKSPSDMWLYRWGNGIILASMYVALLLKVDLAEDGSQGTHVVTALLILANVVMLFAVVVQAILAVKVECALVAVKDVSRLRARSGSKRSMHLSDREDLESEFGEWFGSAGQSIIMV